VEEKTMFEKTPQFYDKLYAWKDYEAESRRLEALIRTHLRSSGRRLLDVACGTGLHLAYLQSSFEVEGLDIDPGLLEVARQRLPNIPLHLGDMASFDLGQRFDIVTCLFSSIGYVRTTERLAAALDSMARHLVPGGLLLVEPWFTPEQWRPNTVHSMFIDEPDLKIARINTSDLEGELSVINFHYLIGTPDGVSHHEERHELGLFTKAEIEFAFNAAGLSVAYDAKGLMGRGLYVGARE
jgi:ubiquinone/menaquinone biosynthesis C-methylase UbiE